MNIEHRFLQKAIEDKNYISFSFETKQYTHIKATELTKKILKTNKGSFEIEKLSKITLLKQKY